MEFVLKCSKADEDNRYGNTITLRIDGQLIISGYDGWTKLTPEEATKLGEALISWGNPYNHYYGLNKPID